MSESVPVLTAFLIVVDHNGVLSVHTDALPDVVIDRLATLEDLEMYCTQVAASAGRSIMGSILNPAPPQTADLVSAALKKRKKED